MNARTDRFVWEPGHIVFKPKPAKQAPDAPIPGSKTIKSLPVEREAFAYIPLSNNRDLLVAQRELKQLFTDDRIEWQTAPTLHITLCHSKLVTDVSIEKMVSLISLGVNEPFSLTYCGAFSPACA